MNPYDPDWLVKAVRPLGAYDNPLDAEVYVLIVLLLLVCVAGIVRAARGKR